MRDSVVGPNPDWSWSAGSRRAKITHKRRKKLKKVRGFLFYGGAYNLVFIRNGANLAHFFRQMPMRQK
jgi:hypothetical protein